VDPGDSPATVHASDLPFWISLDKVGAVSSQPESRKRNRLHLIAEEGRRALVKPEACMLTCAVSFMTQAEAVPAVQDPRS